MDVVIAEVGLTSVLTFVLVFGVAPGLFLRLLVLIYPKNDPRRRELLAELYTLGRVERLLFVGEQFETALFEGTRQRLVDWRRPRADRGHAAGDAASDADAHGLTLNRDHYRLHQILFTGTNEDHVALDDVFKGRLVTKWVRSDMGTRLETYVVRLDPGDDNLALVPTGRR